MAGKFLPRLREGLVDELAHGWFQPCLGFNRREAIAERQGGDEIHELMIEHRVNAAAILTTDARRSWMRSAFRGFTPAVPKPNRAVEDQGTRLAVGVDGEIALAFELHGLAKLRVGE